MTFEGDDAILPTKIVHNCEQIWDGSRLEQSYNFLVYEFETEQHRYRARSYLDEIHRVAVFGPFEKTPGESLPLEGVELDSRVLAYLRRRFAQITRFGPDGYVLIA